MENNSRSVAMGKCIMPTPPDALAPYDDASYSRKTWRELPLYRLRGLQKGKSKLENARLHAASQLAPTYLITAHIYHSAGSAKRVWKLRRELLSDR
jgi:hypothetical protein